MQLISALQIRNFRSIRNIEIDGITDFACYCGQNNVGKSNILKGLNLFFNDQTDPGKALNIDDDYNIFERVARTRRLAKNTGGGALAFLRLILRSARRVRLEG
jgi:predicted ATP-dependent endonuclease of OLD family